MWGWILIFCFFFLFNDYIVFIYLFMKSAVKHRVNLIETTDALAVAIILLLTAWITLGPAYNVK